MVTSIQNRFSRVSATNRHELVQEAIRSTRKCNVFCHVCLFMGGSLSHDAPGKARRKPPKSFQWEGPSWKKVPPPAPRPTSPLMSMFSFCQGSVCLPLECFLVVKRILHLRTYEYFRTNLKSFQAMISVCLADLIP